MGSVERRPLPSDILLQKASTLLRLPPRGKEACKREGLAGIRTRGIQRMYLSM